MCVVPVLAIGSALTRNPCNKPLSFTRACLVLFSLTFTRACRGKNFDTSEKRGKVDSRVSLHLKSKVFF